MSSNQNMKTNSTSNSFMNNNDIIAKVVIERFPSRNEIINFLNTFLKNNHYQKDYEIDTKDKVIIIKFKQFEVAVGFCKYINIEKIDNKLYSKLKAYTILEEVKKNKTTKNNNNTINIRNSIFHLHQSKNSCHLHKSCSCPMLEKKRIYMVKNTYTSVIANTPFTEKNEKIKEERIQNKAKWLQGKNFNSYIGKASMGKLSFIDNYVARDSSIPSYAFQSNLRPSNKFTWINPKGFSP